MSSRRKNNASNESTKVYYDTSIQNNNGTPVTEKSVNITVITDDKSSSFNQNDKNLSQTNLIQNSKETNNDSDVKPSPRFQKNTPSQTESKLKNRIDAKNSETEKKFNNEPSKKLNRNYWDSKNKPKRYRYHHEHYDEKKPSQENFKPGYSSEPEMIEYSLDRSWVSASNKLNTSMPIIDDESNDLTATFGSRHLINIPKLIYYDGSNHYIRPSPRN